jgi:predicted nucleotidyltransferase
MRTPIEVSLRRHEMTIRKDYQRQGLQPLSPASGEIDWDSFIIYRCIVGSRAYGLDHEESDTDRHGIYLPPAVLQWSLYGVPDQLENQAGEECYWELQKFLVLGLKANPNILECLYSPLVEMKTPLMEELLAMRFCLLSQLIYQTYNGYVMSQFKKLEQDIRNQGAPKWKHAMHLIRLLLSGTAILTEGIVNVQVNKCREQLMAIRRGEIPWEEVNQWRLSIHKEFDAALAKTKLPERPDYAKADAFLLKARRSMI